MYVTIAKSKSMTGQSVVIGKSLRPSCAAHVIDKARCWSGEQHAMIAYLTRKLDTQSRGLCLRQVGVVDSLRTSRESLIEMPFDSSLAFLKARSLGAIPMFCPEIASSGITI